MAGTNAGAVIAVKIFVERDEITPVRITLELFRAAIHWPTADHQGEFGTEVRTEIAAIVSSELFRAGLLSSARHDRLPHGVGFL